MDVEFIFTSLRAGAELIFATLSLAAELFVRVDILDDQC